MEQTSCKCAAPCAVGGGAGGGCEATETRRIAASTMVARIIAAVVLLAEATGALSLFSFGGPGKA